MSTRWCWIDEAGSLCESTAPPAGSQPIAQATALLLPPLISSLHTNFHAWQKAGLSPGPVTAPRMWVDPAGELAVECKEAQHPTAIYPVGAYQVGAMQGLAAWLVLLDKWVETFVVIARARAIWSPAELASYLAGDNGGSRAVLESVSMDSIERMAESFNIPAVGASGAIYGILVAFAIMFPNIELMLIFLPIPIKAKYFVPGLIVMDLVFGFTGSAMGIAHWAHIGGALFGFIMAWYWKKNSFDNSRLY